MNDYSDVPRIVQRFLNYKDSTQNRSSKTVFQYYHDMKTFGRYLLLYNNKSKYKDIPFNEIPIEDATDELYINANLDCITDFLSYMKNDRQNKISARQRKLTCLRVFYKYLQKTLMMIEKSPVEVIDRPSTPKKLPKYLSLEDSKKLLESISGNNAVRDYCIITIFLNCGLRVSELCGIDLSDISNDLTTVNVTGKGSKERMLYINEACRSAIQAYLKVRPTSVKHNDRNALFISRNGNRLSVRMTQELIYKHLKNAGLENKNMSVHKLRHTAATLMYQYGKTDVRVLKDILGHEQLSTTQIYTHVNNDMIRDAVNDNPLSSIKQKPKIIQNNENDTDKD